MNARPEFSRQMLRFFLYARAIALDGFAQTEAGQIAARRALTDRLIEQTGLPDSMIRAAFAGQLVDASARAAIWSVLGHFPADRGYDLLTDRSGRRDAIEVSAEGRKPDWASGLMAGPGRSEAQGADSVRAELS